MRALANPSPFATIFNFCKWTISLVAFLYDYLRVIFIPPKIVDWGAWKSSSLSWCVGKAACLWSRIMISRCFIADTRPFCPRKLRARDFSRPAGDSQQSARLIIAPVEQINMFAYKAAADMLSEVDHLGEILLGRNSDITEPGCYRKTFRGTNDPIRNFYCFKRTIKSYRCWLKVLNRADSYWFLIKVFDWIIFKKFFSIA